MRILDWIENTKTVVMSFSKNFFWIFQNLWFFLRKLLSTDYENLVFHSQKQLFRQNVEKTYHGVIEERLMCNFFKFSFSCDKFSTILKITIKNHITPKICSEMFEFYENILIEIMTRWICSENINFMFSSRAQWSLTEFTKLSEIKCALNCEIFFQTFIVLLT